MNQPIKAIPNFINEAQERAYWETRGSTEYLAWSTVKALDANFVQRLKSLTSDIEVDLDAPLSTEDE